ncbi:MAG: YajG family lipoprotein [Armatimonadota bacterium]|nr:YajG family lipoprotein [Armatimonadota bacterium]
MILILRMLSDRLTRSLLIPGLVAASMPLLSGCAFTTGHVNLAYEPTSQETKMAKADSLPVMVQVIDKRPTQTVGQKINGFGMKTADIVSNSDVPATLKTAFETELHSRGFTDRAGGNVVSVSLSNFQNQFSIGFFSGEASATMGMDVSVKRPDGSVAYDRFITGESKDWTMISGEDNAERMLNAAMRNAVSKVFNDNAFIEALNNSPKTM